MAGTTRKRTGKARKVPSGPQESRGYSPQSRQNLDHRAQKSSSLGGSLVSLVPRGIQKMGLEGALPRVTPRLCVGLLGRGLWLPVRVGLPRVPDCQREDLVKTFSLSPISFPLLFAPFSPPPPPSLSFLPPSSLPPLSLLPPFSLPPSLSLLLLFLSFVGELQDSVQQFGMGSHLPALYCTFL